MAHSVKSRVDVCVMGLPKHWLRILILTIIVLLALRLAGLAEGATLRPDNRWPLWGCAEPGTMRGVISLTGEYHTMCAEPAFFEAMTALIPCESGAGVEWEGHVTKEPNGSRSIGRLQVNSVHFPAMRESGLNPDDEWSRWQFAYTLWKAQGSRPWSCGGR